MNNQAVAVDGQAPEAATDQKQGSAAAAKPSEDIYRKIIEFVFRQKHRSGPGTVVMALAMILTVCGVMIAISVTTFNESKFIESVEPLRENKNLVTSTLTVAAAITFITGIWGIASFKIENKLFVGIFGGLAAFVIVINGGIFAIFSSLT